MSPFAAGAVTLLLALGSVSASADFTSIQDPRAGEADFAQILSATYGGSFAASGNDYSNGVINAIRVDDDNDQVFSAGEYFASAKAVFAGLGQKFGFQSGASGGTYSNLIDVTGGGFNVAGEASFELAEDSRFARSGDLGLSATSRPADNPDGEDHMVSFRIEGLGTAEQVILLGLEDRTGGDFDFNDLVVELRSARGPESIPSPAAFTYGFTCLIGLAAVRRRRRHA